MRVSGGLLIERSRGSNPHQKFVNSAMMSTLTLTTVIGKMRRRGRGLATRPHKKLKSLTLHTHGCLRASLGDCSSTSTWGYLATRSMPLMSDVINMEISYTGTTVH